MSRVHRADWVLPIDAPPIRHGWVEVDGDRIVAVGSETRDPDFERESSSRGQREASSEPSVILPGLVNAHTHLELSWMEGRVPPGDAMPSWAARLIAERGAGERQEPRESRQQAIARAIEASHASGTTLVGDVTNSLDAWQPLADSELSAVVFYELLGFKAADPVGLVDTATERLAALTKHDRLRSVAVPHAPYSVSPDLFRALKSAAGGAPMSVHLGESPEEVRFLRDGTGLWRELLERIGAWAPDWDIPGCDPVEYMARLDLLNERLIAVHGVQFSNRELADLAAAGATVVTCPRSNRWTGAGVPPVSRFFASGVRMAIGTDSLASVEDLNMFHELAEVRRLAPDVSARRLLRAATLDGAAALGFESQLGSISSGKRAQLLRVSLLSDVTDVEEYLVGGIEAGQVEWLPSN